MYGFDFSAIKRLAMQEPLVDVVDQEQVVTEACKLSTFNISDMTKSDAAFTVRLSLPCTVFSLSRLSTLNIGDMTKRNAAFKVTPLDVCTQLLPRSLQQRSPC